MSRMHSPAHPGEVLKEYLPENITVGEAAARLGVSRQALSALLNGRAGVSADMARRLSRALNTSAEMWLSMQIAYDLYEAEKHPLPEGAADPEEDLGGRLVRRSALECSSCSLGKKA